MAKGSPSVDIRDTRMDVHLDRQTFVYKDLFQQHASNLTCLNICVWYEMAFRSVRAGPTESQSLFFGCARLDEDVTLSWHLRLDPTTEGL